MQTVIIFVSDPLLSYIKLQRYEIPNFQTIFFASNEVSTCSGSCREILQLCDLCKWGLGGFESHYNPSIFKECLQKNRSPENFQFCNF